MVEYIEASEIEKKRLSGSKGFINSLSDVFPIIDYLVKILCKYKDEVDLTNDFKSYTRAQRMYSINTIIFDN